MLSANGTACVDREDCPCLDLSTGQTLEPGETTEAPDGCNNWSVPRTAENDRQFLHERHIPGADFNLLFCHFLLVSAPVRVAASTVPETPVQVSQDHFMPDMFGIVQKANVTSHIQTFPVAWVTLSIFL